MSEAAEGSTQGGSAGTLLREAREAAGLHIANLAANLKVPVRKLEALEEDRYDQLGDAVFVRALASSVCRTLKVDPQPVLARLPQTTRPRLAHDSEGINAPFHSPQDGPSPGMLEQVSKPVVLVVIALLLGALVLVFLPMVQRGYETVSQAVAENNKPDPVMPPPGAAANVPTAAAPVESPSATAAVNPIPPVPAAANPVAIAAAAPPAVAAATSAARASASAPTASPPVPVAATPAAPAAAVAVPAASAASAPAAAASAPAASGVIVFRTKGPSWIDVTDAGGTTVLRRLMAAGESAGASGRLPLAVTVGDVGQTEVQVRGKPYNLGPVSRDNVARFQVN